MLLFLLLVGGIVPVTVAAVGIGVGVEVSFTRDRWQRTRESHTLGVLQQARQVNKCLQ